jgi:predicted nucleic acid-binding protein
MIVVADASPLVALAICDSLDILGKLFDEVTVSREVYEEVTVGGKFGAAQLFEVLVFFQKTKTSKKNIYKKKSLIWI